MDGVSAWDTVIRMVTDVVERCTAAHKTLDFSGLEADIRYSVAASDIPSSSLQFLGQFLTDFIFLPHIRSNCNALAGVCITAPSFSRYCSSVVNGR